MTLTNGLHDQKPGDAEDIVRSWSDGLRKAKEAVAYMKYGDISELYQAAHDRTLPYPGHPSAASDRQAFAFVGAIMANSPQKPQPLTYFFVDASPLVALAVAERLDILERIGSPFFIADAAAHEIMGMATEPVRQRFRNWANANQNLAKVITTPFGAAYKAAEQMQVEGEVAITRRFAEWLASWVTDNFRALLPQINLQTTRPVGVVLSEDLEMQSGYRIRGAVPSTFHFMSTQAFFRTLKRFHLIAEAQDLWTRVDVSGRPDNSKWRAAARQREREELNSVVDLAAQRARSPKNRSTSGTAQGGGGAPAPRLPDSWKW